MDDRGNIKEFSNEDDAIKAGFKKQISVFEKYLLEKEDKANRHAKLKEIRLNNTLGTGYKRPLSIIQPEGISKSKRKRVKLSRRKNRR